MKEQEAPKIKIEEDKKDLIPLPNLKKSDIKNNNEKLEIMNLCKENKRSRPTKNLLKWTHHF